MVPGGLLVRRCPMANDPRNPGSPTLSRRDLVRTGVTAAVSLSVGAAAGARAVIPEDIPAAPAPKAPFNPRTHLNMPMRNLGKTGFRVGLFSLGGQATIEQPGKEEESAAIVNRALDLGVNYIDTAAAYGGRDQWSQKYIGQVLKHRRSEVFLATKTHLRTYDDSMRLLESSLQQLQTDRLDLWQLHNIVRTEQLDQIFAPGGAIHALTRARDQGVVRFLGITGHADPHVLADGLRRFGFDTILLAVNAADRHHLSFIEHLMPLCLEQELGIIGMKIYIRGFTSKLTFYTTMESFFRYALSQPIATAVIGCDSLDQLEENVYFARSFKHMDWEEQDGFVEAIAPFARELLYYKEQ